MKGGKPSYVKGGKVGLKKRARAKAASLPDFAKSEAAAAHGPIQEPATGVEFAVRGK